MVDFSRVEGLLFDKDGTLIDFSGSWLRPIKEIARLVSEHAGDPALEMQLLVDGGYLPEEDRWAQDSTIAFDTSESLFQRWGRMTSPELVQSLVPEMREIVYESMHHLVPAIPNPGTLLSQLAQNYQLGVASMDDEINVNRTLEQLGITHLVAFSCGADSGFGLKPGPGMVDAFCRQTGLAPHETAVIGDGLHDLQMARAAGAISIGITSGASSADTLEPYADILLRDIGELGSYFNQDSQSGQ